jgi:phytoene synthase
MSASETKLQAAYAECRRLASRHYENFPTASYLVPRDRRDALAAIYAFARYADDVADEPGVENRLEKLADWRAKLDASYAGEIDHPVFLALHASAERFQLSRANFENLLRAFESDVKVNRHPDFNSLLAYCTCSANPVGRLVLELFGYHDPHLFELSDHICTALQLTNFWQDVAIDFSRDRIYLPQEDMARFDYTLDELRAGLCDARWQQLLAFEIARTRDLFERGRGLPEEVHSRLRTQLRLTWLGGTTILTKIEAVSYDVFHRRPSLSKWDFLRLYWRARRSPLNASVAHAPTVTIPS